jgi:hypothetical protein
MRTNTTTPAPTCTPAWSTLVTMAPVGTITSPDDASRGNGRQGSTRHEYTLPTGASGETRRIMWGWDGDNRHQASLDGSYCYYVVCTSMGTEIGKKGRQAGRQAGRPVAEYYWEDGEIWGGGGWRQTSMDVLCAQSFPNYISQIDFRVGYHVLPPRSFVFPPFCPWLLFQNLVCIENLPLLSAPTVTSFPPNVLITFCAATPFDLISWR